MRDLAQLAQRGLRHLKAHKNGREYWITENGQETPYHFSKAERILEYLADEEVYGGQAAHSVRDLEH